jgi:hypothetical protein
VALKFKSILQPAPDVVERIAEITPENPFYTNAYVRVRQRLGSIPYALVLVDDHEIIVGCLGFLTEGRMNARLEITSIPAIPDTDLFWAGLFDSCSRMGVSVLSVNTFASAETAIGETGRRSSHKRRSEYRLDLTVPDLWSVMNRRHHRLVKRARSAGLVLLRLDDGAARERHIELANMSLERLRTRGQAIDSRISIEDVDAFIECGAGEIIQAVRGDEVFSSILIARSQTGAYAQSSGTSEDGRNIGSSHFLFHEAACLLKSEGVEVFNLGGADEHSTGLQEFKLGLGASRIELESAEFYTGSGLKKFATRAAALIKNWSFPIGM